MRKHDSGLEATSGVHCEVDGLSASLDAKELSSAGAFVHTPMPAALDRELMLRVRSEAGEITLQGQVVQVIDAERAAREGRAPGFGVLFMNLDAAQRDWLTRTMVALQRPNAAPPVGAEASSRPPDASERPLNPDVRALLQRLREQLNEVAKLPPYKVLQVEPGCSAADAKAAFFSASKRLHPHMYTRYNCAELEDVVTELFIAHKRAFATLAQSAAAHAPRTPSATRRVAPQPGRPSVPPPAPAPEDSAVGLRMPKVPTPVPGQAPRPQRPPPELRTAPKSQRPPPPRTPSERPQGPEAARARAQLMVTDALKELAAARLEAAHDGLQTAFEIDPGFVQAELWLMICQARMAKADGKLLQAIARYERVLKLEPTNREALAALREAQAPEAGTAKRLLGKLFGARKD